MFINPDEHFVSLCCANANTDGKDLVPRVYLILGGVCRQWCLHWPVMPVGGMLSSQRTRCKHPRLCCWDAVPCLLHLLSWSWAPGIRCAPLSSASPLPQQVGSLLTLPELWSSRGCWAGFMPLLRLASLACTSHFRRHLFIYYLRFGTGY